MPRKEIAARLEQTDVAIRALLSLCMRQPETKLGDFKLERT
jgi:hypothetical protein